ncbi:hypothetical protein BJ742DRAFT_163348 [Cladochytrium replicatum]|nr:hypothetical protein BJ742DRAFT_163348 [Cladochytrium replicatum]
MSRFAIQHQQQPYAQQSSYTPSQTQSFSSSAPLPPPQNPALAILAAIQGSPSPALQHQPPSPPLRVHHPNGFHQHQPYPQQQQHTHQYYGADVHPFRPILQLSDLWQWIDHVPNGAENNNIGQLSQEELRARLQWLLQVKQRSFSMSLSKRWTSCAFFCSIPE